MYIMFTRNYSYNTKFTITGIIFLGKIIMQLNKHVVIVRSLIVCHTHTPEKGAPKLARGSEVVLKLCSCLMVCSSLYLFRTSPKPPEPPEVTPYPGPELGGVWAVWAKPCWAEYLVS